MGRPKSEAPTTAEMAILSVLWSKKDQTGTVRDVQDELIKNRKLAYTSIATIMRILVEKNMVVIVEPRRPQKFKAIEDKHVATEEYVRSVVDQAFLGDTNPLLDSIALVYPKAFVDLVKTMRDGEKRSKKKLSV